jgi:hypothetical protein
MKPPYYGHSDAIVELNATDIRGVGRNRYPALTADDFMII